MKKVFSLVLLALSAGSLMAQPNFSNQDGLTTSPNPVEGEFQSGTVFYTIQNKKSGYLSTSAMQGTSLLLTNSSAGDGARWAILGNNTEGFQFINKATKQVIGMHKFTVTDSENQAAATSSYMTDDLTDVETLFAIAAHKADNNYWVITAHDDHYFYWNNLTTLGYWYSGEGYEYGWYGWKRDPLNVGDNGASFRFNQIETLVIANYSIIVEGAPEEATITVRGTEYHNGDTFNLSSTLASSEVTATTYPGYQYTVSIDESNVIRITYKTIPPYTVNFENETHYHNDGGNIKTDTRIVSEIKLGEQSISVDGAGMFYQDLTATGTFQVQPGENLQPSIIWNGSWMHGFVYVDSDSSDFQFTEAELVAKTATTGTPDLSTGFSSFTAPQTEGSYRMRYKIDWESLDPKGAADLKQNGGLIVDVTLIVGTPEGIHSISSVPARQSVRRNLLGQPVGTQMRGITIENGHKVVR